MVNPDDNPVTRGDLRLAVAELKMEWRQDMLTQIRWIAGLFVVLFISTMAVNATIVGVMLR